ncbi:glycosyltransferase family 4 protein [Lichenicola sp.]|uniref:glycosyltransferase family 4 protein n=1 Tax=Lichenicola sp. TaxID=2804529 RepID=UPI003B006E39
MRILMHHRIASRDGQSVHLEEVLAALRRQGHDVMLIGPASLATTRFGGESRLVDAIKRRLPAFAFELLELAYNGPALLRLLRAIRRHRPEILYERYSLFLFAGVLAARLSRLPLLLEVNSPLFEERAAHDGLRLRRLGRWSQRLLWRQADHVLPVTGVLSGMIAESGVGRDRITVVPNGIDPDRFVAVADGMAAKMALQIPQRLVLGFAGFVRGWNSVDRLIDFVAGHGDELDLHVLVVGDGPASGSLLDHARRRGVADRLTITGVIAREDVAHYIAAFDIAVVPGVTPYASPLKLFEYLQLGRPIIAPDTANIREILTDGHDALLFDPVSPDSLYQRLQMLCEDPHLRARLSVSARQTIIRRSLTWDENAKRISSLASRLVTGSIQQIRVSRSGSGLA